MSKWRFQTTAAKKVVAALETASRTQLIMACGTGKTRVGLRVAEKLDARRVLVLVPSIALVEQTIEMYEEAAKGEIATLAVCSDHHVRARGFG